MIEFTWVKIITYLSKENSKEIPVETLLAIYKHTCVFIF